MKYVIAFAAFTLLAQASYGRDTGYALECTAVEKGSRQIVSFLEEETDKEVNLADTGTNKFWDSHEWLADKIVVRSYMQRQNNEEASITMTMEIDRQTLRAVVVRSANPAQPISMQCETWSPQTRNK